jgi:hypothetical protein
MGLVTSPLLLLINQIEIHGVCAFYPPISASAWIMLFLILFSFYLSYTLSFSICRRTLSLACPSSSYCGYCGLFDQIDTVV